MCMHPHYILLACRFGIGIFFVLLTMLLKVAFDGATWLVEIGRLVGVLYLFLIIVQLIINMKNKPEAVEKVRRGLAQSADRPLTKISAAALRP